MGELKWTLRSDFTSGKAQDARSPFDRLPHFQLVLREVLHACLLCLGLDFAFRTVSLVGGIFVPVREESGHHGQRAIDFQNLAVSVVQRNFSVNPVADIFRFKAQLKRNAHLAQVSRVFCVSFGVVSLRWSGLPLKQLALQRVWQGVFVVPGKVFALKFLVNFSEHAVVFVFLRNITGFRNKPIFEGFGALGTVRQEFCSDELKKKAVFASSRYKVTPVGKLNLDFTFDFFFWHLLTHDKLLLLFFPPQDFVPIISIEVVVFPAGLFAVMFVKPLHKLLLVLFGVLLCLKILGLEGLYAAERS